LHAQRARPVPVVRSDGPPSRRRRVTLGPARGTDRELDGARAQLGRRALVALHAQRGAVRRLPLPAVRPRRPLARRPCSPLGNRSHRTRRPLRHLDPVLTAIAWSVPAPRSPLVRKVCAAKLPRLTLGAISSGAASPQAPRITREPRSDG